MVTHICTEKDTLARIERTLNEMHNKMFVGNGTPAVMVRIDRVERVVQAAMWAAGLLGGTGLVAGVSAIVLHVWKAST